MGSSRYSHNLKLDLLPFNLMQVPKQAVLDSLEHRLKEKCFRVAHWHAPYQDTPSNSTLQLAKIGQLPHLLSQQKEEAERLDLELKEKKRVYRQMMVKKLKVTRDLFTKLKTVSDLDSICPIYGRVFYIRSEECFISMEPFCFNP